MLIASFISGCSYSAGAYTIPISSLNTALTAVGAQTIATTESTERLLHSLLTILFAKNNAGTISQWQAGCEVSNASLSLSSWETLQNTYSDRMVQSFLVSFDCGASTSALLVDGDTVTSV
jgi:hypothetical protein